MTAHMPRCRTPSPCPASLRTRTSSVGLRGRSVSPCPASLRTSAGCRSASPCPASLRTSAGPSGATSRATTPDSFVSFGAPSSLPSGALLHDGALTSVPPCDTVASSTPFSAGLSPAQCPAESLATDAVNEADTAPQAGPSASANAPARESTRQDVDILEFVGPGDVFFVKDGETALVRIGTRGGFLGHVLQVIGAPRCVLWDDAEEHVRSVWPWDVDKMWVVKTLESTREAEGLYEADSLIYVDPSSQGIVLLGREDDQGVLNVTTGEDVEVWQPPQDVRSHFRTNLMLEVVVDMKNFEASWSFTTAVRALLLSGMMARRGDKGQLMADIESSWAVDPICTSIVIIFWQRYLSKLAQATSLDETAPTEIQDDAKAVDLIRRIMPVKADRVLPGELKTAMTQCGWSCTKKFGHSQTNKEAPKQKNRRTRRSLCRTVCA